MQGHVELHGDMYRELLKYRCSRASHLERRRLGCWAWGAASLRAPGSAAWCTGRRRPGPPNTSTPHRGTSAQPRGRGGTALCPSCSRLPRREQEGCWRCGARAVQERRCADLLDPAEQLKDIAPKVLRCPARKRDDLVFLGRTTTPCKRGPGVVLVCQHHATVPIRFRAVPLVLVSAVAIVRERPKLRLPPVHCCPSLLQGAPPVAIASRGGSNSSVPCMS